ncbi:MAG: PQQ-binding-like beta-propeller repeat protein [Planctomycetes bacterium]|nr:PQQ-binding-like beta-propeller repeat protein [Planctomycetota bacterium]
MPTARPRKKPAPKKARAGKKPTTKKKAPAAAAARPAAKKKARRAVKLFRFAPPPRPEPRPAGPPLLAWACAGRLPSRCASVGRRVAPPLEVAWRVRLSAPPVCPPVVSGDGVIYLADRDGRLHALDAREGHPLFSRRTDAIRESSPVWPLVAQGLVPRDRVPVSSSPVVFEWHLLFGDDEGIFYCLRRGEAEVIWRKSAPLGMGARQGGAYQAPLVAGEAVITVDAEGNLYAGSARNGTTLFKRYLRGRPAAPPALAHRLVVVTTTPLYPGEPSVLHALHVETGERSWHRDLPGAPGPALATTREHVLVGGAFGLRAHAVKDGALAWAADVPQVTGPLAHDGATVVAPVAGGGLVGVDAATGARRWTGGGRAAAPVLAGAGPAIAGDVVWTAAEAGLVAWELATGKALGRVRVPEAVGGPVLFGEGRVLVATSRGELLCLRPSGGGA